MIAMLCVSGGACVFYHTLLCVSSSYDVSIMYHYWHTPLYLIHDMPQGKYTRVDQSIVAIENKKRTMEAERKGQVTVTKEILSDL